MNGVPYRLCAESMARSRTHGSARINVQGRGLGAVLDAPYSPALNFGNATTKTAQQLAADWGAQWVDAGAAGHINSASQLGDWPQGHALLQDLVKDSVHGKR